MSSKSQLQDQLDNSPPPSKEGWLHKQGGAARSKWQSRWFSLRGELLFYSARKDDGNPLGCLNLLEAVDISKIGDHSGKKHCITIVGTKGNSKKVYYIAADNDKLATDWHQALKSATSDSNSCQAIQQTKYATAEVFVNSGLRINGDVEYNILAALSQRTGPEKKRRDYLGWYCEKEVPLATVLNTFAEYGWVSEKIYRSSALLTTDNSIQPVIRIIFVKKPHPPTASSSCSNTATGSADSSRGNTPSIARRGLGSFKNYMTKLIIDSGITEQGGNSSQVITNEKPVPDLGANVLEGTDDELIELMQEFDIPLSLLQLPSV